MVRLMENAKPRARDNGLHSRLPRKLARSLILPIFQRHLVNVVGVSQLARGCEVAGPLSMVICVMDMPTSSSYRKRVLTTRHDLAGSSRDGYRTALGRSRAYAWRR
ncbi:hypothetical protein MRB53_041798 [Persea americana]|nr:hypothetical protein MRB53_041798 [Persea americana]